MRYCFLLHFIFLFGIAFGQVEPHFARYTTDDGLPANYVSTAFQDHHGFLWFGMRGGCCRFNGYSFKTFPVHTSSGKEELYSWITDFAEDNNNNLYLAGAGDYCLLKFDRDNEVFIDYLDSIKLTNGQSRISTSTLTCDQQGDLWIGTNNSGVFKYTPQTGKFIHLEHNPDNTNSIYKGNCLVVKQMKDSTVWIGIRGGLCVYDPRTKIIKRLDHIKGNDFTGIYEDSNNDIWLSIDGYLHKYDQKTETAKLLFNENIGTRGFLDNVGQITEDNQKRLWLSSNKGLVHINVNRTSFGRFKFDETNQESINSNMIKHVLIDQTGNLWACTSEGIAKMKKQRFRTFQHSATKNSIRQNKVQSIIESKDKELFIAIPNGIDVFDPKKNHFVELSDIKDDDSNLSRPPIVLCEDNKRGIWIGTYRGGLSYYNYKTRTYTNYKNFMNDSSSLHSNSVFALLVDSRNNVWVGTWGGGVFLFNRNEKEFIPYHFNDYDEASRQSKFIRSFFEDSNHNIWIGTLNGVAKIEDMNYQKIMHVFDNRDLKVGKKVIVYCFEEGINSEYLWIGTNIGLARYHVNTNKIKLFSGMSQFPKTPIFGVLKDRKGGLWLSTSRGLVHCEANYENEPAGLNYEIFRKSDGLQGDEFLPASFCKSHDGTMIFGGVSGFSMFHPDSISKDMHRPQLAFTSLEISSKPVKVNEEINGQIVLKKSINKMDKLVLNHKNNNFSIEFVALHFNQPEKNQYLYFLDGFDTEWKRSWPTERRANYMNLDAGKYILRVKASNSDGMWNNEGLEMNIEILPPWWKTWWFQIVLILFFVIILIIIIQSRTILLSRQKQKLERVVDQRTRQLKDMNVILQERQEELRQQANELVRKNKEIQEMSKTLHEADQSKLRFFANISHEFRTPLSLIIAPVEKYLAKKKLAHLGEWNDVRHHLQLVFRNATRLLRLVNQILDFRKLEQGNKTLYIRKNNIIQFIQEVIQAFSSLAETKGIHLSLTNAHFPLNKDQGPMINEYRFDPDIMEKILFNLISNAIKYTPEGGEIYIQLKVKSEELRVVKRQNQNANSPLITHHSSLIIKITDTGIGIKPENLNKIFDRFYREDSNERIISEGAGIGLAYTKELVEFHQGSISVDSSPGKGTTFFLKFQFLEIKKDTTPQRADYNLEYIQTMIGDMNEGQNIDGESIIFNPEKQSILLVEDNIDLRTFIKGELESDYNVIEAQNGKEGIEMAGMHIPDIIVSDIMMPVMDGIEFCKKIKQNQETSHIPIILLTAKSNDQDIMDGLKIGADDYITKPFKLPMLMAKIENIIKQRRQLREKFIKDAINLKHSSSNISSLDDNFLLHATQIVKENLTNHEFNNDMFFEILGMSKSVVYRKMKAITNQSVSEFIRVIRLKIAANLLLEGTKNISEVAFCVGFKHREHLTRYFTEFFGKSPSEYQKSKKK